MFSFRLFKIPVHVHPFFWLTLALIGGGLRAHDAMTMVVTLMFVLAGFISILVHEMGHALMIRKYGLPTDIHLVAFGGFARYPQGQLTRKQSFFVTAAGPGTQFALGILALGILQVVPVPEASMLRLMLRYVVIVSFFWSLLNCLPIHPLDGVQMLAAVLGPQRARLVYLIGTLVAVLVGLTTFLAWNAWVLLIFMGLFAYQNWQQYQMAKRS